MHARQLEFQRTRDVMAAQDPRRRFAADVANPTNGVAWPNTAVHRPIPHLMMPNSGLLNPRGWGKLLVFSVDVCSVSGS